MKRIILLAALVAFGGHAFAQDLITKKDAVEIEAKILRITSDEIEYKAWNNLDGPVYTLPVEEVFTIKYENGSRDVFTQNESRTMYRKRTSGNDFVRPHYEGEIAAGFALGSDILNHIAVETVHGVRFLPYFYAGFGFGFNYFYNYSDYRWNYGYDENLYVFPVYTNFKGFYPISDKVSIYGSVDLGVSIAKLGSQTDTDFYTSIGPGVQIGSFDLSIRYQRLGEGFDAALFRIGCRF